MRFAIAFVPVLLLMGCRTTVPLDGQLALGPSIQVANLEVWPVLAERTDEVDPVLTLAQAQEKNSVVISELDDAQVGRLAIENRGDTRILACAGTVVTGGRQDRQLGEDIVVDPGTAVSVKVFCVEPGRWTGAGDFAGTSLQTSAPVRAAGQYENAQQQVWLDVQVAQAASIVPGGSYGSVRETEKRRRSTVAKVEQHLRSQRGNVVGYAYAIDGSAAGIRTFAHPALLEPRLQGFVRAMCVEAELQAAAVVAADSDEFVPPQITQVGVSDEGIELVPSCYSPPDDGADAHQLCADLRMASDAYDRGDYERAETKTQEVLARDPDNEAAKELARIAKESGRVANEAQVRERLSAEWQTVMRQLQARAQERADTEAALRRVAELEECNLMEPAAYLQEAIDAHNRGDDVRAEAWAHEVLAREPDNRVAQDIVRHAADRAQLRQRFNAEWRDLTTEMQSAALPHRNTSRRPNARPRKPIDIPTLFRKLNAKPEEISKTEGANRNGYRRAEEGNHSACYVQTKDGRWVPLTRDWTAK